MPMEPKTLTVAELAKTLDHSVLQPNASTYDVREACELAIQAQTATLCVRSADVPLASSVLRDTGIPVASVVGFPHGSSSIEAKEAEIRRAILDGASEVDVVMNYSRLLSEDPAY